MSAFRASEIARLSACLAKLLPHVRASDVAITGGVAIQRGLAAAGRAGSRKDIYGTDDLDCRRCALSADPRFPLAPKDRIFSLLGWTRQPAAVAAP